MKGNEELHRAVLTALAHQHRSETLFINHYTSTLSPYSIVTSAQFDHTCAVESQSYLNPTTYFPGFNVAGILTSSRTAGRCERHASSQGGGKVYCPQGWRGGLSHREQSLPAVSGHGSQCPDEQFPGVVPERVTLEFSVSYGVRPQLGVNVQFSVYIFRATH